MLEKNLLVWVEISEELWNDVPQNEEDLSYMFDDETTPVKAVGDLAYNGGKTVLWNAALSTLSDELFLFLYYIIVH